MASGDYAIVRGSFWTDPDVKRPLGKDEKLLLLYWFTSPHRNLIGLYYCPLTFAASETGLTVDEVRAATFGPLAPFVSYDEETEEVLVHAGAKHQIGETLSEKDNQRKAVVRVCGDVHSPRLLRRFLELYSDWNLAVPIPPEPAPGEGPRKVLGSPSEAIYISDTVQRQNKAAADARARETPAPNPAPEPATVPSNGNGTAAADCVRFVEGEGYGAREKLVAEGEDITAWQTHTGAPVPWPDRLRLLRLADARVKDRESPDLRRALRYVILQQYDPTKGPTAADLAARAPAEGRESSGGASPSIAPPQPTVREIEERREAEAARYADWRARVRALFEQEPESVRESIRTEANQAIGELVLRALPVTARGKTIEAKILELYGARIGQPQPVAA